MKLITFASFKGGAGKTTSLMAAAGALAAQGYKVGLFEADENEPLSAWRDYAQDKGTWDERCAIRSTMDLGAFETAYEAFEQDGFDIVMADTQGGGSDLNATILASSDLIVIPTALTRIDVDSTLDTYAFVDTLFQDQDITGVDVGILVTQLPTGKLTAAAQFCLETVENLPSFDCRLPSRSAFADLKSLGMLHLYHAALSAIPAKRIAATHIATAMKDADRLAADLLDAVGLKHAAA